MTLRRRSVAAVAHALVPALVLALAPALAGAQVLGGGVPSRVPVGRHMVGGAGMYGQPLGEFGENVKRGFGLDGAATFGVDARGIFGIRGELGYLQYNRRTEEFFVSTGFGLVELESQTKSGVLTMGIGPQISAPAGPVRPYAAATIGFARFATTTAIVLPGHSSNSGEDETLEEQTVSSDFIQSLGGTVGVGFAVPAFGRGIMVDIGARYHRNGRAEYVTPAGVDYDGTGNVTVTPTEGEADFVVYRIGILVPIR